MCPACGSGVLRWEGELGALDYGECRHCGLVFVVRSYGTVRPWQVRKGQA